MLYSFQVGFLKNIIVFESPETFHLVFIYKKKKRKFKNSLIY